MTRQTTLSVILGCCGRLGTSACAEIDASPATTKGPHASVGDIAEQLPPPRAAEEWETEHDKKVADLVQELEEQRKRLTRMHQQLWQSLAKNGGSSATSPSVSEIASADQ